MNQTVSQQTVCHILGLLDQYQDGGMDKYALADGVAAAVRGHTAALVPEVQQLRSELGVLQVERDYHRKLRHPECCDELERERRGRQLELANRQERYAKLRADYNELYRKAEYWQNRAKFWEREAGLSWRQRADRWLKRQGRRLRRSLPKTPECARSWRPI